MSNVWVQSQERIYFFELYVYIVGHEMHRRIILRVDNINVVAELPDQSIRILLGDDPRENKFPAYSANSG